MLLKAFSKKGSCSQTNDGIESPSGGPPPSVGVSTVSPAGFRKDAGSSTGGTRADASRPHDRNGPAVSLTKVYVSLAVVSADDFHAVAQQQGNGPIVGEDSINQQDVPGVQLAQ
jgi:hypothetical protein